MEFTIHAAVAALWAVAGDVGSQVHLRDGAGYGALLGALEVQGPFRPSRDGLVLETVTHGEDLLLHWVQVDTPLTTMAATTCMFSSQVEGKNKGKKKFY